MKRIRRKVYNISKKTGDKIGLDLPYFVENGFWAVSGQFVIMLSGLLLTVLFTHFAPQKVYGQYQLILSILGIVSVVSLPGFNTAVARSAATNHDGSYRDALGLRFKWSFIGMPILWAIAGYYYWYKQDTAFGLVLFVAGFFFPLLYAPNMWQSFLQGKSLFNLIAGQKSAESIANLFLMGFAIYFFGDYFTAILLVFLVVKAGFNILFYFRSKRSVSNNEVDNEGVSYGWYLTKIRILNIVVTHFDKIIVGLFDVKMLAVYAVALKLFEVMKSLIKSGFQVTFPKFAVHQKRITSRLMLLLFAFGLLASIILFFTVELVIVFLFSGKYLESTELFKIIVWILPFTFVLPLLVNKVTAQKDETKIFRQNIYAPLISLAASVSVLLITDNFVWFIFVKLLSLQIARFVFLR